MSQQLSDSLAAARTCLQALRSSSGSSAHSMDVACSGFLMPYMAAPISSLEHGLEGLGELFFVIQGGRCNQRVCLDRNCQGGFMLRVHQGRK